MSTPPFSALTSSVEAIEIYELGDVGLHSRDVATDRRLRLVQLRLPSADNEHIGAFVHERLRGGKADSAAAAGDDGDLPIQFAHDFESLQWPLRTFLARWAQMEAA